MNTTTTTILSDWDTGRAAATQGIAERDQPARWIRSEFEAARKTAIHNPGGHGYLEGYMVQLLEYAYDMGIEIGR